MLTKQDLGLRPSNFASCITAIRMASWPNGKASDYESVDESGDSGFDPQRSQGFCLFALGGILSFDARRESLFLRSA